MKIAKRIRALEARFLADPTTLYLPDGSTRQICGRGDYLLDLFVGALNSVDLSPSQAADLELIRQSVDAREPGSAHMTELIRCFLNGPAE